MLSGETKKEAETLMASAGTKMIFDKGAFAIIYSGAPKSIEEYFGSKNVIFLFLIPRVP